MLAQSFSIAHHLYLLDARNGTSPPLLPLNVLHGICRSPTEDEQGANHRSIQIYTDHYDCRVRTAVTFKPGKLVYVHLSPLSLTAAERMATDLNQRLLPRQLSLSCILSCSTETAKIDEDGIPRTISCEGAMLALQSEIDGSAKRANVLH